MPGFDYEEYKKNGTSSAKNNSANTSGPVSQSFDYEKYKSLPTLQAWQNNVENVNNRYDRMGYNWQGNNSPAYAGYGMQMNNAVKGGQYIKDLFAGNTGVQNYVDRVLSEIGGQNMQGYRNLYGQYPTEEAYYLGEYGLPVTTKTITQKEYEQEQAQANWIKQLQANAEDAYLATLTPNERVAYQYVDPSTGELKAESANKARSEAEEIYASGGAVPYWAQWNQQTGTYDIDTYGYVMSKMGDPFSWSAEDRSRRVDNPNYVPNLTFDPDKYSYEEYQALASESPYTYVQYDYDPKRYLDRDTFIRNEYEKNDINYFQAGVTELLGEYNRIVGSYNPTGSKAYDDWDSERARIISYIPNLKQQYAEYPEAVAYLNEVEKIVSGASFEGVREFYDQFDGADEYNEYNTNQERRAKYSSMSEV